MTIDLDQLADDLGAARRDRVAAKDAERATERAQAKALGRAIANEIHRRAVHTAATERRAYSVLARALTGGSHR